MKYDRLSAQDTTFLRIEKPNQPQHVGSLSFFEAAPLRDADDRLLIDELRSHIAGRLHLVPRLRQRLMFVPLGQGRPIWVDDEHFDIAYHVRLTALPRPGDEQEMVELVSRLQSQPLDRQRPLWEMWFIDGVADDRVGLIIKTHHALGDGIASVDLGLALLDAEREPGDETKSPGWRPAPVPAPNRLFVDSVVEEVVNPARLARNFVRAPRRALRRASEVAAALRSMALAPEPAPWNVPVSQHRRWRPARVSLDDAQHIKKAAGAKLNDVVVAACTGALRSFLTEHGEGVDGRTLKAMVPVSRRLDSERGSTLGNRVSLFVVDLPIDEADPLARLETVHTRIDELKGSRLVDGAEAIVDIADLITPVAAPLTRFVTSHIPMNLVITNIPGPPVPLYLRGARLLETFPYVEVVDNEGLTIAVVSYDGQLLFGITSDRDVVPDLDLLAELVEKEFQELSAARG